MDLSKWNVFNKLASDFKSTVRYAFVFGDYRDQAIVITDSDEVYGMGTNKNGCLGIGTLESTVEPKKIAVLCGKRVKSLACGYGPYVVALTEAGQIYTWGDNSSGQLGYEGGNCSTTPNLIADVTDVIFTNIACGSIHSLAVTDNGKVYGWGKNDHGQINCTPSQVRLKPQQVTSVIGSERIKTVACTSLSSFAVTHNKTVYGWGKKDYGQLVVHNGSTQSHSPFNETPGAWFGQGQVQNVSRSSEPIKIPGLNFVIVKIVCGVSHVLVLTSMGKIYSWGHNKFGQLGLGHTQNIYEASLVNIKRAADVIASPLSSMSAALLLNGTVFVWGLFQGNSLLLPTLMPFKSLLDVMVYFPNETVMYDLSSVNSNHESSVVQNLSYAFNNSVDCDVTFVVEGKEIHAHKTVLMLRSKYFSSMFRNEWKEACAGHLVVKKYSYTLFKAFLYYLYTGKLEIEDKCLLSMLELSNYYMDDNLKMACTSRLKCRITVENVLVAYKAAVTYNFKELKEFCLTFSLDYMSSLVLSEKFLSLDHEMTIEFIQNAAKAGIFNT